MGDDDKQLSKDAKTKPTEVFVERTGYFELFKDTTKTPEVYFAKSMLDGKIQKLEIIVLEDGTKYEDAAHDLTKAKAVVKCLNVRMAAEKAKKNENCTFCADRDMCLKRGDEKLACKDPVQMSDDANPFMLM